MAKEELMETIDEIENTEIEEMDDEVVESGGGLGKIVVGIGVVAAGALAALAYKNKAKLEERRIEKLRKKGYVVYKEDEDDDREELPEDTDSVEDEDVE